MVNEQKAKLIELKQKVNDFEFELDKYKEEFMRRIAIFVILFLFIPPIGLVYLLIDLSKIKKLNQKRKSLESKIREFNYEINKIEISLL
ncbi:hypothetical protein [Ureaplasma urealyticum]|uniref:Uncharacterized protein n=2 Tax=Ureaplasma urealyticum TaxID=2130 RepID=A0ABD4SKS7_UREUR|nr:hypothetical protein [Ureaplasma urealyticum]MCF1348749.1 hypothetical protein [Ureaplasma urealyticum]QDI63447.1 hypothetical protein EPH05_00325 [Ureaplasma urealyticum]